MKASGTAIPGCYELTLSASRDRRGTFVKAFDQSAFEELGLSLVVREIFHSQSSRDVVRGLHFQLPPRDLAKLVWCVSGIVFDVVVDLRVGSPTYLRHHAVELSEEAHNAVLVPMGCAHGFATRSEHAVVAYAVSEEFDPDCDAGIRFDSAGVDWPVSAPVVSDRDAGLPALADFTSPFVFASSG